MIYLQTVTIQERINISFQCEHFFLQVKPSKKIMDVFNLLITFTDKRNRSELWCILTACLRANRYHSKGSQLSLDPKKYAIANKIHKQRLSITRMHRLISDLEDAGMITMYKGFKGSMMSCFLMSDTLEGMMPNVPDKEVLLRTPDEFIEIKDYTTGEKVTDCRGHQGVALIKEDMTEYNKLLNNHTITIDNKKANVCYKRVFANSLNGGGRFYTLNGFMNNKSYLRKTIKIDGNCVTEVDYCNLHPRILHVLNGEKLSPTWEPYAIPDDIIPHTASGKAQLRNLCKLGMMCILYSKSKRGAISAIVDKVRKDKESYNLLDMSEKGSYTRIIETLIEKNSLIKDSFFDEDGWKKLQHIDSKLCTYIIKKFTRLGKVCLPYHDSWVVVKEDQQLLIDSMREAWFNVFSTEMNFKYKVEF